MTEVEFKLIKMNGHTAYTGMLGEEWLPKFLEGSGAAKITYTKDGKEYEIINPAPRV